MKVSYVLIWRIEGKTSQADKFSKDNMDIQGNIRKLLWLRWGAKGEREREKKVEVAKVNRLENNM